jgi:hypothetical protein
MFSSEGAKNEVQERSSFKDADFQQMFEELETTGTVTLDIPNPYAEGDASLLEWLKSGFTE